MAPMRKQHMILTLGRSGSNTLVDLLNRLMHLLEVLLG